MTRNLHQNKEATLDVGVPSDHITEEVLLDSTHEARKVMNRQFICSQPITVA
jgi:hypothetical protein